MTVRSRNQLSTFMVTGLSGAGKSIALNAFEDSGYFCVDNLPVSLIKSFVHLCDTSSETRRVAVGVDIRERQFFPNLAQTIASLKKTGAVNILYLEARDNVLVRRFKETRRPHPLGYKDLKLAIRREKDILSKIRDDADRVIDTSSLTPHQLRKVIFQLYAGDKDSPIVVSLISFGYKFGIPADADLLFDVRFLPNPFFVKELRDMLGTSPRVRSFVMKKKETGDFLKKIASLLTFLIPKYKNEGRNYLTIGIGCTGGVHRSPVIVEELGKVLQKKKFGVSVSHRDIHEERG